MSAVPAVRATVAARSIVRRSETRKLAAPSRSVAARAITETVAESQGADSALYDEFKKLLVDYEFSYKVGDRVSGKVFHCDSKGAWVDIGAKAAALCPASESSLAEVRNVSTRKRDSDFLRARANDGEVATLAVPASRRSSRRRRAPAVAAPTLRPTRRFRGRHAWIKRTTRAMLFRQPRGPGRAVTDPTRPSLPTRPPPNTNRPPRCSTSARSTSSRSSRMTTATVPSPSPSARFRCVSFFLVFCLRPNCPRPSKRASVPVRETTEDSSQYGRRLASERGRVVSAPSTAFTDLHRVSFAPSRVCLPFSTLRSLDA